MARRKVRASYYGRVEGAGTPVSRRGGKESGLKVLASTREAAIEVKLSYDEETGKTVASVVLHSAAEPGDGMTLIWKGWI